VGERLILVRYWAMPSLRNVVSVARMTSQPGYLLLGRWAASEPGWVQVPSLYRLVYDGEGGTEVTEIDALEIMGRRVQPARDRASQHVGAGQRSAGCTRGEKALELPWWFTHAQSQLTVLDTVGVGERHALPNGGSGRGTGYSSFHIVRTAQCQPLHIEATL